MTRRKRARWRRRVNRWARKARRSMLHRGPGKRAAYTTATLRAWGWTMPALAWQRARGIRTLASNARQDNRLRAMEARG